MIGAISQIDLDQLRLLLQRGWVRRISSVHIHHTWRPNHAQWQGKSTVEAIRRYHVEQMHWSDIAEHLTIGPDGSTWTGRNLDRPPASVAGHNGTEAEGPFMIEMVGDFDVGQDNFDGAQAATVYQTVAEICTRFQLKVEAIRFHNEFTNAKTCPGTSLKLPAFRAAVAAKLKGVAPVHTNDIARAYAARASVSLPSGRSLGDAADAEPRYDAQQAASAYSADGADRGISSAFPAADVEVFRSHVVNLSHGRLSDGGAYKNGPEDLDEMIRRLGAWVQTKAASGATPHVVFFAHGGLVNEKGGLGIALRDHLWWLANGVYPIFFVWETGIMEVFSKARDLGERALSTDDILEATLGPTVGRPTWDRIKDGAFLASSVIGGGDPGGAALLASKLATWVKGLTDPAARPTFHAVGHSAGSIMHCHYLPAFVRAFQDLGMAKNPLVKTLAFLAPAARTDLFEQTLQPNVGAGKTIAAMTMFTMTKHDEKADNCGTVYRKSLLYFVRNACERPTPTPILGLAESVREDPSLAAFFGLSAGGAAVAEAVWSPTPSGAPSNAASTAVHHGDFDEDSPTMDSVMRRILSLPVGQSLPCPHLPQPRALVADSAADGAAQPARGVSPLQRANGAFKALCIGIDSYGPQSLNGCVADSQSFVDALSQWGFTVQHLTNERATRDGITTAIAALLSQSNAGDTVVLQYAGHGTQLADLDSDESDGYDEAWVPYDYTDGEFVIDDDLGALFDRHRDRGIRLVVFADCCHSGTSTRFMLTGGAPQNGARSRYLQVPPDIAARYSAKRGLQQSGARFGKTDSLGWEIHFAACQDNQSAYERDGHGDFTRAATSALAAALRSPVTYAALAAQIAESFRGNSLQVPMLRALQSDEALSLFGAARQAASQGDGSDAGDLGRRIDQLTVAVNALTKKIDDL